MKVSRPIGPRGHAHRNRRVRPSRTARSRSRARYNGRHLGRRQADDQVTSPRARQDHRTKGGGRRREGRRKECRRRGYRRAQERGRGRQEQRKRSARPPKKTGEAIGTAAKATGKAVRHRRQGQTGEARRHRCHEDRRAVGVGADKTKEAHREGRRQDQGERGTGGRQDQGQDGRG